MNRLTKRIGGGIDRVCHYGHAGKCYGCADRTKCNANIFDRLAHYEDLEEQGRLVELPCKIGDIVYDICDGTAYATRVLQFVMFQDGHLACRTVSGFPNVEQFGTRIFLSESEAESALAVSGKEG